MLREPRCSIRRCRYFTGVKQDDDGELNERNVCAAFLNRIPDEIAYGDNLHETPLKGQDNDIVFEKEPKRKAS